MEREETVEAWKGGLEVSSSQFPSALRKQRSLQPSRWFYLRDPPEEGQELRATQTVATTSRGASTQGRLGVMTQIEGELCYLLSEWVQSER